MVNQSYSIVKPESKIAKPETRNSKPVMKLFAAILLPFLLLSCKHSSPADQKKENDTARVEILSVYNDSISLKIYQQPNGWGYDISVNGKLYVHQPHIPAVSGVNGFRSEADAKMIAGLMAHKISHHISQPSVSVEELDSLGVK